MRKLISASAIAAVAALPLLAGPTEALASCRGRANTGTAIGAVGGALLGNAIHHGAGGAIVGGLGGAVVGHQIAKSGCRYSGRTYSRRAYYRHHHHSRHHERAIAYYDAYGRPVYR